MPELPEEEILSRQLRSQISGREVLSSKVYDHKLVDIKNIGGRRVITVEHNSKMINIFLDDGNSISVHLRTTGRFLWQENAAKQKT
jgi:formamidopyrimidine-DNA glycosylase